MKLEVQIGQLIAKYRKQKGFSQERLAALSDVHPDYVGKIERGERMPSVKKLLNIINQLGMSYSKFFDELKE